jgi:hypothetical protein
MSVASTSAETTRFRSARSRLARHDPRTRHQRYELPGDFARIALLESNR